MTDRKNKRYYSDENDVQLTTYAKTKAKRILNEQKVCFLLKL